MNKTILKSAIAKRSLKDIKSAFDVGDMINVAFGYKTFRDAKREGKSFLNAAAAGVVDIVVYDAIGIGAMLGYGALKTIPKGLVKGTESLARLSRQMNEQSRLGPFTNATFADSQQAYTMRQAGMQMAQASKYNLQQTLLGNEARHLHR